MNARRTPDSEPSVRLRNGTPIIWRNESTVQFGDHPHVLQATGAEIDWLRRLGEHRTWDDAARSCPTGSDRAARLLEHARACGALEPGGECWWLPPQQRHSSDPILAALAAWHPNPAAAIAARQAMTISVLGTGNVANVIAQALRTSGFSCLFPENPMDSPSEPAIAPHLTVLIGSACADAPEVVLGSIPSWATAAPYLPVAAFGSRASIGPLVLPGRTPCLRCLYLHHRDRDSQWPSIVAQWLEAGRLLPRNVDPLLALQCGVHIASLVRAWTDAAGSHEQEPTHSTTLLQIHSRDMSHREVTVTTHAECGCLWRG